MSPPLPRKAAILLQKASKQYASAQSAQHRLVQKALSALSGISEAVVARFEERATRRETEDAAALQRSLRQGQELLANAQSAHKASQCLGDSRLLAITGPNLILAQRHEAFAKQAAANARVMTEATNGFERRLWTWYDDLLAAATTSLWDDAAGDKAIAILSGATIAIGLVPGGAAVSAVAGAALLGLGAKGLGQSKRVAKADAENVRTERAVALLKTSYDIGSAWLTSLK